MSGFDLIFFLAQTTVPATSSTTAPVGKAPWWAELFGNSMFPLVLGIGVLYFFVFRSKRNQDKGRDNMLKQMKRGDRVETIGGILGKVVDAEESKVLLKVDENSNTKIWFSRSAIRRVIDEEKAESK